MSDSDSEDDYGMIQPSLIKQLKAILDQYPDDGQVLKELIQNAEDAGATEVTFIHDQRSHGINTLHQRHMAKYQGPGLLAYNNAGFAEDDWIGIRRLYDSVKEKDPLKVGRFGLGFKSVFHLTDFPSVVSGQRLLILDPHQQFKNRKGRPTSGKCWDVKRNTRDLEQLPDQFSPYMDQFGCTKDSLKSGTFSGTLFRFPLRQQPSKISSTEYDNTHMKKLFECFETDAHLIPLFLKKVEKISLCTRGKQAKSEKLLFVVQVAPSCIATVRQKRAEFIKELKQAKMQNDHIATTYKLSIETIKGSRKMTFHYLVRECYACGEVSTTFSNLRQEVASSYKPMVGVAMLLTNPTDGEIVPEGQTFCVLPLSKEERSSSGLPVHVNGYFSVGQNRRDLKWKTSGQREDSDKDVAWNLCLLNEVLPQCYAGLITDAIALEEGGHEWVSTADVYTAIPDVRQVHDKWKMMLDAVFRLLIQQRMLYTEACNGRWVSLRDSYLISQEETEANIVVKELLLSVKYNVVTPPAHIKCIVDQYSHSIVTPQLVREALKWHPDSYTGRGEGWKLTLLEFVLQDKNFDEIEGINLLPVDDGTFKAFGSGRNEHIYIPSHAAQRDLLPGLESKLMRRNIDARLEERLKEVAMHGKSRLKRLEITHIPKLIRDVLPAKWHNKVEVCYNPGEDEGPPRDWFEILWKYMATYHPNDLGDFEGLTLLPVANTMPLQLIGLDQSYPKAIMVENNGAKLTPTLCKLMVNLGVHLVDDLPRYVKNHPSVVGRYIKLPTAQHVTDILLFASQRDGIQTVASTLKENYDAADDLINLLSREPSSYGSASKKQLLQKLPLFETTLSTSAQRDYASVHEVGEGVADHHFPVKLPCRLLLVPDQRHQTVSKALGATVLTLSSLVRDYLIPCIKKNIIPVRQIQQFMMHVFESIHALAREDSEVYNHFKDVAFVETQGGTLVEPCNLYSPNCTTCQSLFCGVRDAFPRGVYAQPDKLIILSKMGLKTKRDLGAEDVKEAMLSLGSKHNKNTSGSKARAILEILNDSPRLLSLRVSGGQVLSKAASSLSWVPVEQIRPVMYPESLPWAGTSALCKPSDCVTTKWGHLVGSIRAVVRGDVSPELAKVLGWNQSPSIEMVKLQLKAVVQRYRCAKKNGYMRIISDIYGHFQRCSLSGTDWAFDWVWIGKGFTCPGNVVFRNTFMNLEPFMYVLPSELQQFDRLFSTSGVRKDVDVGTLVDVLHKVKKKHDAVTTIQRSEIHKDCQLTISILNQIRETIDSLDSSTRDRLLVPVQCPAAKKLILLSVKECSYCDTDWVRSRKGLSENIRLVHQDLPPVTASMLGVTSIRESISRNILDEHATARGFAFGQSEDITNALKRVLKTYPCNHEVLKELIQNADDAKATKIHFIHDRRHHPCDHIFQETWKPLQGPALCVYNNSPFTEKDLEGIQQFGIGAKGHDPTKTGQYGIGFSSVYHLTDAPSVLTSGPDIPDTLCVLDPHCRFVPGATREKPGRRFEDLEELREQFPDVFGCYLEEFNDMENATMLRLPLRNDAMAKKSKIAVKRRPPDIRNILDMLIQEASDILLFVNHLRDIEVSEITESGALVRIHRVHAELSRQDTDEVKQVDGQAVMGKKIKEASANMANGIWDISDIPCATTVTFLKITDSNDKKREWCVAQRIGITHDVNIPSSVEDAISDGNLSHLPRGGAAAPLDRCVKGRVFCFLPIPLETMLPIHVNGHFALGHENRRHLWTHSEREGYRKDWNDFLCKHVISRAYVELLIALKTLVSVRDEQRHTLERQLRHYQSYFPVFTEQEWNSLKNAVYTSLASLNSSVLPIVVELPSSDSLQVVWHCLGGKLRLFIPECAAMAAGSETPDQRRLRAREKQALDSCLIQCKFGLLNISEAIGGAFERAEVPIQRMSPAQVLEFFSSHPTLLRKGALPKEIGKTPIKTPENLAMLLKYCQKDQERFEKQLDGLPLLLTADGKLRQFDSINPVYFSRYAHLFTQSNDMFLDGSLLKEVFSEKFCRSSTSMKALDIEALPTILSQQLPRLLKSGSEVKCTKNHVSNEWLRSFWTYIHSQLYDIFADDANGKDDSNGCDVREEISTRLEPIGDWCLLPTRRLHSTCLVAIKEAHMVLVRSDEEDGEKFDKVFDVLQQCGVYELQSLFVDSLSQVVTSTKEVIGCLKMLHAAWQDNRKLDILRKRDADVLLRYFNQHVETLKKDPLSGKMISDIPIHTTIHGNLSCLTGYSTHVFPTGIPSTGIEVSEEKSGALFLKHVCSLDRLYMFLGCKDMSLDFFYRSFIFQHFEYFDHHDQMVHLHYLHTGSNKETPEEKEERNELVTKMKDIAIIKLHKGKLQKASYFRDQHNPVFAAFQPQLAPPKATRPFTEDGWTRFLRRIGLVTTVSIDFFLACANHIARNSCTKKSAQQSKILMKYVFDMRQSQSMYNTNLTSVDNDLRALSQVCFVEPAPPSPRLTALCPTTGQGGYMQLHGAIPEEHCSLVWTQVHMLPKWADPVHAYIHPDQRHLMEVWGIQGKPPISIVLDHLRTLGGYLIRNTNDQENDKELKKRVFKSIYRYLQQHLDDSEDTDDRELRLLAGMAETPCLLVEDGTHIVAPSQTTFTLHEHEQIKPFFYKVPDSLMAYRDVFLEMGTTATASVEQYAKVLANIHREDPDWELNPNQMKYALKATKGVFVSLSSADCDFPECALYLPSQAGRLVLSTELVHNDVPSFSSRISGLKSTLLVDLLECGLEPSVAMGAVANMPLHKRPRLLSTIMEEVLVDSAQNSIGQDNVTRQLNARLKCDVFQQAVRQLLLREEPAQSQDQTDVVTRLAKVKVSNVNQVRTMLRKNDGGSLLKDSTTTKLCHVDTGQWTIYIKEGTQLTLEHLIPLAKVINQILDQRLRESVLDLLPLLTCPKEQIVNKLRDMNVASGVLHGTVGQSVLPRPGTTVPGSLKRKLDANLSNIEERDYVVYQPNRSAPMVYGIVDQITSVSGRKRYRLDMGDRVRVAKGQTLFTFK